MPAQIRHDTDDVYVLRISGLLKRSEFGNVQDATAIAIDAGVKPRILVLVERFEGFERNADWSDLEFLFSHGNEVERIAIVADPRWEAEALAFAGAGFRRAPVKFFPSGQESEARAWLSE